MHIPKNQSFFARLRFAWAGIAHGVRTEHSLRLDDPADAATLDQWMRDGLVLTVHSQEGTLEDVFVALAGRAL